MKKTLAVVIVFLLVFSGIGIIAEASGVELKIIDKRDEGLKATYDGEVISVYSEKKAAFIEWEINGIILGYETSDNGHRAEINIEEFKKFEKDEDIDFDLSSGPYNCIVQAYDINMNPLYNTKALKPQKLKKTEKERKEVEVIEKGEGIEVTLEQGRFITVYTEKEAKYVEWTINGKTLGYQTDKTNHRAQIDLHEFNLEPNENYKVFIQAYDFDMTPLYERLKEKIQKNKESDNPTITVVQEIPYKNGKLEARVKGNKIQFLLNDEVFARGTVNDDGTFYIPIDTNKQINTDHTKAYNVIRIKLTNQEQL